MNKAAAFLLAVGLLQMTGDVIERSGNEVELPSHDWSYQTGTPGILRRARKTA